MKSSGLIIPSKRRASIVTSFAQKKAESSWNIRIKKLKKTFNEFLTNLSLRFTR